MRIALIMLAALLAGCSSVGPSRAALPLGVYAFSEPHGIYVCVRQDGEPGPGLCGVPSIDTGMELRDDTCRP